MNEVEKMYKTIFGEFAPNCSLCAKLISCEIINNTHNCNKFECNYQRLFTAEKQIELIKWLGKLDGKLEITCTYNKEKFIFNFYFNRKTDKNHDPKYPYSNFLNEDIEILIASLINNLWQDLTEEEKMSIKNILET